MEPKRTVKRASPVAPSIDVEKALAEGAYPDITATPRYDGAELLQFLTDERDSFPSDVGTADDAALRKTRSLKSRRSRSPLYNISAYVSVPHTAIRLNLGSTHDFRTAIACRDFARAFFHPRSADVDKNLLNMTKSLRKNFSRESLHSLHNVARHAIAHGSSAYSTSREAWEEFTRATHKILKREISVLANAAAIFRSTDHNPVSSAVAENARLCASTVCYQTSVSTPISHIATCSVSPIQLIDIQGEAALAYLDVNNDAMSVSVHGKHVNLSIDGNNFTMTDIHHPISSDIIHESDATTTDTSCSSSVHHGSDVRKIFNLLCNPTTVHGTFLNAFECQDLNQAMRYVADTNLTCHHKTDDDCIHAGHQTNTVMKGVMTAHDNRYSHVFRHEKSASDAPPMEDVTPVDDNSYLRVLLDGQGTINATDQLSDDTVVTMENDRRNGDDEQRGNGSIERAKATTTQDVTTSDDYCHFERVVFDAQGAVDGIHLIQGQKSDVDMRDEQSRAGRHEDVEPGMFRPFQSDDFADAYKDMDEPTKGFGGSSYFDDDESDMFGPFQSHRFPHINGNDVLLKGLDGDSSHFDDPPPEWFQ